MNFRKQLLPALLVLLMGMGSFGAGFANVASAAAPTAAETAVGATVQADTLISFDDVELIDADEMDFSDIEWTDGIEAVDSTDDGETDSDTALAAGTDGGTDEGAEGSDDGSRQSLWAIFIAGFVGGFAAFLMPCIFPLLPLTVSF